jgi:hypothetical protein
MLPILVSAKLRTVLQPIRGFGLDSMSLSVAPIWMAALVSPHRLLAEFCASLAAELVRQASRG